MTKCCFVCADFLGEKVTQNNAKVNEVRFRARLMGYQVGKTNKSKVQKTQ